MFRPFMVLCTFLWALFLSACNINPNPDTFVVKDQSGNPVATAKSVPSGTTIEECVDAAGAYMGEAYCPNMDEDMAYPVSSLDPFNGGAPTCLCLSAGNPGDGWDSVSTSAQIATFDCDDTDAMVTTGDVAIFGDVDGDGHGAGEPTMVCGLEEGDVTVGDDCDDTVETGAMRYPGNPEVCDGIDNDCDGEVDDELEVTSYYWDDDFDGHGAGEPTSSCSDLGGDYSLLGDDCNDMDGSVFPGAVETCNSVDDNCDGNVDSDTSPWLMPVWYRDVDVDTYGDPESSALDCAAPEGYVSDGADCNDGDAAINPGASEILDNEVDENCDGVLETTPVDNDVDGDGYDSVESGGDDCNDGDINVNPGMSEISFNGVDDNCDGLANTSASATIVVTPNADQMSVSWELWLRDGTNDPTGSSTATWAAGGAASGMGALTGTVTVTNGHVEYVNGPMSGGVYWAFMTLGTQNVSTTISVNGYPFTVTNTCWDGGGCPGTDGRWTVNTQ